MASKMRSVSQSDEADTGLDYHTPQSCLGCYRMKEEEENKLVFHDAREEQGLLQSLCATLYLTALVVHSWSGTAVGFL